MMHTLIRLFLWPVLAVFIFTACEKKSAIVHELNERDANEIFVLLSKSGIPTYKTKFEKNQKVSWAIEVDRENELLAQNVLVSNNLPRQKQSSLEEICGAKVGTMILTPKQEKCREMLALKGGIINLLTNIQGVVSSDVLLNIPEKEQFGDSDAPQPRPTAAVTIQWLDNGMSRKRLTKEEIQNIVASSVKDMDARDVTVHITEIDYGPDVLSQINHSGITIPAKNDAAKSLGNEDDGVGEDDQDESQGDFRGATTSVAGLSMDAESASKFKVVASIFLFLFLVLSGAFIFVLLRLSGARKKAPVQAREVKSDQADSDQKLLEAGLP